MNNIYFKIKSSNREKMGLTKSLQALLLCTFLSSSMCVSISSFSESKREGNGESRDTEKRIG